VPSGLLVSNLSSPLKPVICPTSSAKALMLTSSPTPTLTISDSSYCCIKNTAASARSSTCRNSRRGVPVPQISTQGRSARAPRGTCGSTPAAHGIPAG
jgi:hypothetical protein